MQNESHLTRRALQLFIVHFEATHIEKRNVKPTMRCTNHFEIRMYPTQDKAATIGRIDWSILNCLPSPIEEETWGQVLNQTG